MNGIAQLRSLLRGKGSPRYIEHGEWPEQSGRRRVLIENPDAANLWAHADILREAGYDVATCVGPAAEAEHVPRFRLRPSHRQERQPTERQTGTLCPLIAQGHCPLVEGADVVVSTIGLTDSREILATLRARNSPVVVVEGTSSELERDSDVIGDATEITEPVTPEVLLAAVEDALSGAKLGSERPAETST